MALLIDEECANRGSTEAHGLSSSPIASFGSYALLCAPECVAAPESREAMLAKTSRRAAA